ncbi:MAG: uridylate kinase [Acidimicrobiales bacterium]|jgi:uridylate kinase
MHDMSQQETIVMSVGGSLIVPDAIDTHFLSSLKDLIETETANGRHFIIIAGGGRTARNYQEAAGEVATLTNEDLDWLGLHATRLNGHLLLTIFRELAHRVMVTNPDDVLDMPKDAKLIIAAGYRPGASTDLRAIQIADLVGAKKVINLSNIDYVYTEDPKKNPNAEKIEDITWEDFRKLIPEEWGPGLNSPFDPVAAKEAQAKNIEVASLNGTKLISLKNYLDGNSFTGTRIHN